MGAVETFLAEENGRRLGLLREFRRRHGGAHRRSVVEQMTEPQRAVHADAAKFRALLCGSRAGKTLFNALDLSDTLDSNPRRATLFLSLSRDQARNIIWEPWQEHNERLGLGLRFIDHTSKVIHRNGAQCLIRGADTRREIDKYRGIPTVKVKVDEAQAFRPDELEYLTESVLTPRTMDYGGVIDLSGTPGMVPHGYWHDVSTGKRKGWSLHGWDARRNPHVNAEAFFATLFADKGWTWETPTFVREYLGRWILDVNALVFAFLRERSTYVELPRRSLRYVLAMDFGVQHGTAWTVLAYTTGDVAGAPRVYVVRSFKRGVREGGTVEGNAPSEVADTTRDLIERYRPETVVGDLGGMGKAYAAEMLRRHGIAIQPAQKDAKRAAIEITSDALRTGHLLSHVDNESLHRELETLQWDENHADLAPGQIDDEAMSLCYGFRACPVFAMLADRALGPHEPRDPHARPEDYTPPERPYNAVEDL